MPPGLVPAPLQQKGPLPPAALPPHPPRPPGAWGTRTHPDSTVPPPGWGRILPWAEQGKVPPRRQACRPGSGSGCKDCCPAPRSRHESPCRGTGRTGFRPHPPAGQRCHRRRHPAQLHRRLRRRDQFLLRQQAGQHRRCQHQYPARLLPRCHLLRR